MNCKLQRIEKLMAFSEFMWYSFVHFYFTSCLQVVGNSHGANTKLSHTFRKICSSTVCEVLLSVAEEGLSLLIFKALIWVHTVDCIVSQFLFIKEEHTNSEKAGKKKIAWQKTNYLTIEKVTCLPSLICSLSFLIRNIVTEQYMFWMLTNPNK